MLTQRIFLFVSVIAGCGMVFGEEAASPSTAEELQSLKAKIQQLEEEIATLDRKVDSSQSAEGDSDGEEGPTVLPEQAAGRAKRGGQAVRRAKAPGQTIACTKPA